MDQPATSSPASARDIILEIVRNMQEGLEPLHFTTLPPSVFHVYLHPDDLDRLRAILPRIEEEARQALDHELASLNRLSLAEKLKLRRRDMPAIVAPTGGWQIRFLENNEDDAEPGAIMIDSELALPPKPQATSGSVTKRIATRRTAAAVATAAAPRYVEGPAGAAPAAGGPVQAVIEYEDNGGHHRFEMTKDQIVIGRGGADYWTDLKLDTLPDVSREHVRLRRDPANGNFFLKDLSRLGTTINGERAPSSIEFSDTGKRDRNLEVPLPAQATLVLAGVLTLEFRAGAK